MKYEPLSKRSWKWIYSRSKPQLHDNTRGVVAVCDSGDIAGVCIFDSWTDAAAEVHICIENPMCLRNGGLLKEMFGYAFNSCNRAMLIARIPEGNPKSLNFAKRVGFKEIYLIPDAIVQGEGLVGLQLKREDCRYIEHLEIAA